jgi:hypothetical protein
MEYLQNDLPRPHAEQCRCSYERNTLRASMLPISFTDLHELIHWIVTLHGKSILPDGFQRLHTTSEQIGNGSQFIPDVRAQHLSRRLTGPE